MEHNAVKSPLHYTEGRRFEPKDVIRDWDLNFNLGSAIKYIARTGRKSDPVEDLEKAREFLAFEIEALKADTKPHKEDKPEEEYIDCEGLKKSFDECISKLVEATFNDACKSMAVEVPNGIGIDEVIGALVKKLKERGKE